MSIAKRLKKMVAHGLTFVEHCVNLAEQLFSKKVFLLFGSSPIGTVFMGNLG